MGNPSKLQHPTLIVSSPHECAITHYHHLHVMPRSYAMCAANVVPNCSTSHCPSHTPFLQLVPPSPLWSFKLSQPSSHWCTSLEAITATTNAFSKTQHLVLGMPPLTYFEPCRCKVPPHMPMLCPLIASVNQGLKCRKISAIFLCEISLISRLRHNIRHWLLVNGNFSNFPKITPRYLSVFSPIFWEISRYFLPVQPAHRIQNLSNFYFLF